MIYKTGFLTFLLLWLAGNMIAQKDKEYKPVFSGPKRIAGMSLTWNDEFNINGKPDPKNWKYENGFVRNEELQWYQPNNAYCEGGLLIIEGRRQKVVNPSYNDSSSNWKLNRQFAEYTSASLKTQGLHQFFYGRLEVRARIDTSTGSWPAIWTLGINGNWPLNGEVDMMEFYRIQNDPTILANLAWGTNEKGDPNWNTKTLPLSYFMLKDAQWNKKFHVWRMEWNKDSISLFLDDELLNTGLLKGTHNPDGYNPFLQPHYLLLNLAIGSNGGDPGKTNFPIKYEVDYVRYYRKL
jgi:beta-glucanase (GH16 family)